MMFRSTDTQHMMVEMSDKLMAKENEFEVWRRRLGATPADRLALWPHLAEQGLIGALASESLGGFGGTARDLASLMALAGKWLVVEPLLHSALALHALEHSGGEFPDLAGNICTGETLVAFAHQEGSDPFATPKCDVRRNGDQLALTGTKHVVRHEDLANHYQIGRAHV